MPTTILPSTNIIKSILPVQGIGPSASIAFSLIVTIHQEPLVLHSAVSCFCPDEPLARVPATLPRRRKKALITRRQKSQPCLPTVTYLPTLNVGAGLDQAEFESVLPQDRTLVALFEHCSLIRPGMRSPSPHLVHTHTRSARRHTAAPFDASRVCCGRSAQRPTDLPHLIKGTAARNARPRQHAQPSIAHSPDGKASSPRKKIYHQMTAFTPSCNSLLL